MPLDEPADLGLQRIIQGQIDKAIVLLDDPAVAADTKVHEVRKRGKKIRGVLRLFRGALPKGLYQHENAAFRDLARPLAELREAAARLETLDALRPLCKDPQDQEALTRITQVCVHLRAAHSGDAVARRLLEARDALTSARDRLPAFVNRARPSLCAASPAAASRGGAEKTYRRNRRAWPKAYVEATTEAFHEWRKRTKYHRYHCALLRGAWPKPMKGRERALHTLTDLLGREHDLADLAEVLKTRPEPFPAEARLRLLRIIEDERAASRARARPEAERAFAEKPKRWSRRTFRYAEVSERSSHA